MDRVRSRTGALQKKDLLAPEELAVYSFGVNLAGRCSMYCFIVVAVAHHTSQESLRHV